MKVLIAADIFPPESGGPATYAVTLANELTQRGDAVTIVSLNPQSDTSAVSCSVYRVSWKNKFRYFQYLWLLYKHAKSVDIIYAMGPVNAGLPALVASWLRGKKLVVKVVGDYAWEQSQTSGAIPPVNDFISVDAFQNLKISGKIGWLQKIERFVCRHADTVITPSEYLKKIVVGWGVQPKKVVVIYNAVEFRSVTAKITHPEEQWVVSVGRLMPWKGMGTLIEIMPVLVKIFPKLKLKIIGDGPETDNLRVKIKDLRLSDCVQLAGNLSHTETLSYINSANVFVLNSGYEGMSHVLLEALFLGRTVLASGMGGNGELLGVSNLFEYENRVEIIDKIGEALVGNLVTRPVPEILRLLNLDAMINKTKEILQKVCVG